MPARLTSGSIVGLLVAAALFYVGRGLHDVQPVSAFVADVQAQETPQPGEADFEWKAIEARRNQSYTFRAKLPGGWLVRRQPTIRTGGGAGAGLTFVPDPVHKWDGKTLPWAGGPHHPSADRSHGHPGRTTVPVASAGSMRSQITVTRTAGA